MNLLVKKRMSRWMNPIRCLRQVGIHWSAALLLFSTWQGSVLAQSSKEANNATSVSARHVIGLEGVRKNAQGQLSVANDTLKFQKNGEAAVEIKTASITSVSTGQQDKQVGGIPVALGRAATPFGGGRAIALFSHKKYDVLTLEYQDKDGGLHGAVFQVAKGQAQRIQNELAANGVRIGEAQAKQAKSSTEEKSENK